MRHQTIPKILSDIQPSYSQVLDIGCSLGQLTSQLIPISQSLISFDVSISAVEKAESNCGNFKTNFLQASLPGLPFRKNSFELIVASDAIHEFVQLNNRDQAVREIFYCLEEGGICLFSDYLKTEYLTGFIKLIERNGFKIFKMVPLNDRLWYQFESYFKAIRHWNWVKNILASVWIARLLQWPARLLGKYGSRHVLIVARKIS